MYSMNLGQGGLYYGGGTVVTSWHFLAEMEALETLQVGGCPFDPIMTALDNPLDSGSADGWCCPALTTLELPAQWLCVGELCDHELYVREDV